MTDTTRPKSVMRISLTYSIAMLLLRSANFVLLPLYTHFISARDFGFYSVIIGSYLITAAFVAGGIQSSFSKLYLDCKDEDEKKSMFTLLFVLASLFALIFAIPSFLFSDYISEFLLNAKGYSSLIMPLSLVLILDSAESLTIQLLKTKEEVRKVIFYSWLQGGTNIILILIFLIPMRLGIAGIIYAQLVNSLLMIILYIPILKRNFRRFNLAGTLKPVLTFTAPLIFIGIFSTLTDFADRWLINRMLSAEAAGVYSFAYRLGSAIALSVIAFRSAFGPRSLIEVKDSGYSEHFGRVFTKLVFALIASATALTYFYPMLFRLQYHGHNLANPLYKTNEIVPLLVMGGYIFSGLMSFYSVYPYKSGKSHHLLVADIIACAVNISMNILLIPRMRLTGAALSTTLGFAAGSFYLFYISRHEVVIQYEWRKIIPAVVLFTGFIAGVSVNPMGYFSVPAGIVLLIFILSTEGKKLLPKNMRKH